MKIHLSSHRGIRPLPGQLRSRSFATLLCVVCLTAIPVGCAGPTIKQPVGTRLEGYDEAKKRIEADPVAFLKEALAKAREVRQFKTEFFRQERLGPFGGQLRPMEHMVAEYRAAPLGVRFTWLDDDSEYRQAVFMEGRHDGKVLLLPRKGLFGLPPKIDKYPPTWAVIFGKSKFPITDFGPRRMMEKTIDRIDKAARFGKVQITLKDPAELGDRKEPCFHFELRYPQGDPFPAKLQDLYVHTQTHMPVGTFMWLSGKMERTSSTLDAMYQYIGLEPQVELTDATFKIDLVEKAGDGPAKKVSAGKAGSTDAGGAGSAAGGGH